MLKQLNKGKFSKKKNLFLFQSTNLSIRISLKKQAGPKTNDIIRMVPHEINLSPLNK
jgi:hypothetical protein